MNQAIRTYHPTGELKEDCFYNKEGKAKATYQENQIVDGDPAVVKVPERTNPHLESDETPNVSALLGNAGQVVSAKTQSTALNNQVGNTAGRSV